jgi:hypothetical protein
LNEIATEQTKAMENTQAATDHMLDYLATRPDATIHYYASDMILHIHSDVSYLSVSNTRSCIVGNNPPQKDDINGSILNTASVIKNIVVSAAESEAGEAFLNAQSGTPI